MIEKLYAKLIIMQMLGHILMGLAQMVATYAVVHHIFGVTGAILFSIFIGWTPIIGSILSVWGATEVWGWPWYWSVLLFFWPNIIALLLALLLPALKKLGGVDRVKPDTQRIGDRIYSRGER